MLLVTGLGEARADSFDDAVFHYLKGFEACKEANGLLRSGQVAKAKEKMAIYQKIFAEARKMDGSIVGSSRRGMDGNIKFCDRVANNLKLEEANPFIDKAVAHCDTAKQLLKADNPEGAAASLEAFRAEKNKALAIAPNMMDIFAIASQMRRCERLEKKIAKSAQKKEALGLSIETAKEESESYLKACQQVVSSLKSNAVDDSLLRNARRNLSSAKTHKKDAKSESLAFREFEKNPAHEAKAIIEQNLSKGDRCVSEASTLIKKKTTELANINVRYDRYLTDLRKLGDACTKAERASKSLANDNNYQIAKKLVQQVQREHENLRKQMRADKTLGVYNNWPKVKKINSRSNEASKCVKRAEKNLNKMFASIQREKKLAAQKEAERIRKEREKAARLAKERAEAAKRAREEAERRRLAREKAEQERIARLKAQKDKEAAEQAERERQARLKAEAEAKAREEAAAAAAAAAEAALAKAKAEAEAEQAKRTQVNVSGKGLSEVKTIAVKMSFDGLAPDYALIYVDDNSKPPSSLELELTNRGFEKDSYIIGTNTKLKIKNFDNSLHRIVAVDDYNGFNESLVRLYPRQRKNVKVTWGYNSIVEVRSEKGVIAGTNLITIPSGTYKLIDFEVGVANPSFTYNVPSKGVTKAYIIMPDHDLIMVDFSKGNQITAPVLQKGEPVGYVEFIGS